MTISQILLNRKYWLLHFLFVAGVSIAGLIHIGEVTYSDAPPFYRFVSKEGKTVVPLEHMQDGAQVFLQRGLMALGSFWGDGAERGPDWTADALHEMVLSMKSFYAEQVGAVADKDFGINARVAYELHTNGVSDASETIELNDAQVHTFAHIKEHHKRMFNDPKYPSYIRLGHTIDEHDMECLSAYIFWGAWVTAANRPNETYSYTHNWPYDPAAGNVPTSPTLLWSVLSVFILFLATMLVLYVYGQLRETHPEPFKDIEDGKEMYLTTPDLENDIVRPTQLSTYRFFYLAMICFGLQVLSGIICATDFVRPFGIFLGDIIPFSVARSYHAILQIYWFFMCWVGYTIFFLPRLSKVPVGQQALIDLLYYMCATVGAGCVFGIYLGQRGILTGSLGYWLGSQGWEFMELGRAFQILMLAAFTLWVTIIFRAVRPWLTFKNMWSVPAWLLYGSGIMVLFLFFGLAVQPRSNFAIANFWRWMVVHMWVEVTFEVFTTVIVAYMMVQMNYISRTMAENTTFLAVMMFLFTATLGVAHNFYWIAKPTSIIALGSAFSTMQVVPLLLLTLDAWKMHRDRLKADSLLSKGKQNTVMSEVWLYLLAVNFWNIFGAGVFGSVINLPIVNYYEHATYMTNNHAHGAMFGVKGNVALGGMLYCCQHLFKKSSWDGPVIRSSFWCLQIGIGLMMFLDLFPVGLYQVWANFEHGLWYARSHEITQGQIFKVLTYFRSIGGMVFVFGGLIPLILVVVNGGSNLKQESVLPEVDWRNYEANWAHEKDE